MVCWHWHFNLTHILPVFLLYSTFPHPFPHPPPPSLSTTMPDPYLPPTPYDTLLFWPTDKNLSWYNWCMQVRRDG